MLDMTTYLVRCLLVVTVTPGKVPLEALQFGEGLMLNPRVPLHR